MDSSEKIKKQGRLTQCVTVYRYCGQLWTEQNHYLKTFLSCHVPLGLFMVIVKGPLGWSTKKLLPQYFAGNILQALSENLCEPCRLGHNLM